MSPRILLLLITFACAASAQQPPTQEHPLAAEERGDQAAAILRRARDGLFSAGEYSSALLPAQELVTTLRPESDALAGEDLLRLALIQTELEEYDDAELTYLEAIRLIASDAGEFSLTLVEPYHALGRSYLRSGKLPEALVALEQARHVSQRNLGLFNVEQTPLLDDMTRAHLGSGNTVEAERLQVQRLDNAVRRFGADDERVVPFRLQLADYYERSRLHGRAREQYLEVVSAREALNGPSDASLLAPLRELAAIDLIGGGRSDARDRLRAILDQHPRAEPMEAAMSWAVLGDWALVGDDMEAARELYGRAYAALAARDGPGAAEFFSRPIALDFIAPLTSVDRGERSRRPYTYGRIILEFSVSEDGRPWNVMVVASEPSGLVDSPYIRRLRETHFRPRLVDGRPVATPSVQFTHHFRYYVDD